MWGGYKIRMQIWPVTAGRDRCALQPPALTRLWACQLGCRGLCGLPDHHWSEGAGWMRPSGRPLGTARILVL